MSTMSKTYLSYLKMILAAEYVLNIVPVGTHHWDKFINPEHLQSILQSSQLDVLKVQGVRFSPISSKFSNTSNDHT